MEYTDYTIDWPQESLYETKLSIIGRILKDTKEDPSVSSGIVSMKKNVPLSLWPLVLERAWKQDYFLSYDGAPSAMYYVISEAIDLRMAIGKGFDKPKLCQRV